MLRITISKTGQPPNTTSFDKREITIGRTASNDIRIPEPGVSSNHARVLNMDGAVTLLDLSSTNGTFVNGTRIQGPHIVQPGDEVYVCSHKLEFEVQRAAGVASGPAPVASAPPMPGPALGSPPPIGAPPPPIGGPGMGAPPPPIGAPPPVGAPPPIGAAPPPIGAPPPSIPPSPRPDPSLPPPLDAGGGAPPSLAVPSAVSLGGGGAGPSPAGPAMPTLPPMIGGGGGAPGPEASAPPDLPPAPEPLPPPAASSPSVPEPPAPPPSSPSDAPPPLAAPPPIAAPPPVAAAEPEPPSVPPSIEPPAPMPEPVAAPPSPISAPEPVAAPPAIEPPPSSSSSKAGAITPSTSAPSAKGELATPTHHPKAEAPSAPKVVLGSKSPVRTGATMMADHVALERDEAPPEPEPEPAAWSMPRVGPSAAPVSVEQPRAAGVTPTPLHPAGLAGLSREAQTREACRQVFVSVRDTWLGQPSLDDEALMGKLRNGLQELKAAVGHLEPMSLSARMQTELCGVGPLGALLRDGTVQEVFLQGPDHALVTRNGQSAGSSETVFSSPEALAWVVSRISGESFDAAAPVLEATTAEGHRVHAIHHSLVADGPVVRIQRTSNAQPRYDLQQLTGSAMLSDSTAKILAGAVQAGLNIAVFTGPGAHAFPLAAALALAAPPSQRQVVVRPRHEAAQLPANTVLLQNARAHAMPGLVDAALGLSPSRLLVHDIAGEEAAAALTALGRGLDGVVLTSRAASAERGLYRLAALSGLGGGSATSDTRALRVAVSLDLIVVLHRFGDGITRVTSLSSPGVSPSGTAQVTDLVTLDPHSRNWTHTAALQSFVTDLAQRGVDVSPT